MQYREIGNSGITASAVALGTWGIGGGSWWQQTDDDESIRAIQAAIDEGITLIDTAPVYGYGHSEEVVGKAIAGRRDKVVLATKCGLWWADDRGATFVSHDGESFNRCLTPETIRIEIEDSLRRLNTDVIDLYQTHWQEPGPDATPIAETMGCLMELQAAGKIRAIGVSNCTPAQMDEYLAVGRIESNQPRYNMLDRGIEADLLPYCIEHHIATLAYSPLEQGLLTGKITMDATFDAGEIQGTQTWIKPVNRKKVLGMLEGWQDLCDQYQCTRAQLAIAWTLQQPGLTFTLCGARKVSHVKANAAAGDLVLADEHVQRLRRDVESLGAPE